MLLGSESIITTNQLTLPALFRRMLEVYLEKSYIARITLSWEPPASPLTMAQLKAANRKMCKPQGAEQLETKFHPLRKQVYRLIFTDGSYDDEPRVAA